MKSWSEGEEAGAGSQGEGVPQDSSSHGASDSLTRV